MLAASRMHIRPRMLGITGAQRSTFCACFQFQRVASTHRLMRDADCRAGKGGLHEAELQYYTKEWRLSSPAQRMFHDKSIDKVRML
jgi:hypothetical protein